MNIRIKTLLNLTTICPDGSTLSHKTIGDPDKNLQLCQVATYIVRIPFNFTSAEPKSCHMKSSVATKNWDKVISYISTSTHT